MIPTLRKRGFYTLGKEYLGPPENSAHYDAKYLSIALSLSISEDYQLVSFQKKMRSLVLFA